jgi:hypothetical protein
MRAERSPRRLHPALALTLALALHAGLLVASRAASTPAPSSPALFDVDAELELFIRGGRAPASVPQPLPTTPADAITPAASVEPLRPRSHTGAHEGAPVAAAPAPQPIVAGEAAEASATPESAADSAGSAAPRAIDLGLNGGVRRSALLGGWSELAPPPKRPSDGGLRQALAALDAERGLSRSSAAHSAAYRAARQLAPARGIGIFEVLADERGSVLSVTLAGAASDAAKWERVGRELQRLLKDRRLRVPPGAKGLLARLRIETGDLALDVAERFRTRRGAALGEGAAHPREIRAESTRKSLEPGQLSPTLGVTLAGGGSQQSIRVVLLDERAL